MRLKIFLGILGLCASATPILIWGAAKTNKNYKYGLITKEEEKWRKEFFKKYSQETTMCQNKENCENGKRYLPTPYESWLWEELWKKRNKNNEESNGVFSIKNSRYFKNHCYMHNIKSVIDDDKVIDLQKDEKEFQNSINKCTLSKEELKKLGVINN